ncbi:MAG: hypothetical protein ACR2NM_02895 [Bythopirellula sp.]
MHHQFPQALQFTSDSRAAVENRSPKPMLSTPRQSVTRLIALACCALLAVGCAGWRCPRIDPSGERLFICSRDKVPPVAAASANVQAPPLYTDAVFPQPVLPPAGSVPPIPQDRLSITPNRVLAPVGSEVILKAGLCTSENFLLTDSKIEWLLARDEVGEFVSLGGRGWCKDPWLPWNKPKKIDNHYATGYTARVPLLITRGTADRTDDVQVEPGEAWASITSPVEGTSRITAVAPEVETWANRRATATIYWVDVAWTFPPAAVTAGGGQVLTTTVRRHTDGTPIEGWLVRYEVADGGGALRGSESGQVVEVPTDAQGRASIDVTPTGSAGTTTRINTQVVRPKRFDGSNAPRLEIANGVTTIQWTDGGSDYVPPPDDLGSPLPTNPLPPTAPIQPAPARQGPKLELEVHQVTSNVLVGGEARFEVVIRNVGDSTATGVVLRDVFDQGLTHPSAPPGVFEIENKNVGDIGPGDSRSLFLTFGVQQAGRLRQVISATSREGARIERQAFIEVQQPQRQPEGRLQVTKQGPRQRNVGEAALFTLSIKNVGEAPLTNLEVVDTYDPALQPQPAGDAELRSGSLFWRIPRLGVGETWRRDVNCQCAAPQGEACGTLSVTAETGTLTGAISQAERSCTEIRPKLADVVPPVAPPAGGDVVPNVVPPANGAVGPNATGPLQLELIPLANPVRAGTRLTFRLAIRNAATTADQQVRLRVLFPPELEPDVAAIRNDANIQAQFNNGELLFEPISEMRANERLEFVIPCNVNQQGVRNVTAELISRNLPQGVQQTKEIQILGR